MPPAANLVIAGDNWLAILAAAAAIYAIGFLIYGLVFTGLRLQRAGDPKEQLYSFGYIPEKIEFVVMSGVPLLLGFLAAAAINAGWR